MIKLTIKIFTGDNNKMMSTIHRKMAKILTFSRKSHIPFRPSWLRSLIARMKVVSWRRVGGEVCRGLALLINAGLLPDLSPSCSSTQGHRKAISELRYQKSPSVSILMGLKSTRVANRVWALSGVDKQIYFTGKLAQHFFYYYRL